MLQVALARALRLDQRFCRTAKGAHGCHLGLTLGLGARFISMGD
jgi:hypothetical protein